MLKIKDIEISKVLLIEITTIKSDVYNIISENLNDICI